MKTEIAEAKRLATERKRKEIMVLAKQKKRRDKGKLRGLQTNRSLGSVIGKCDYCVKSS